MQAGHFAVVSDFEDEEGFGAKCWEDPADERQGQHRSGDTAVIWTKVLDWGDRNDLYCSGFWIKQ